MVWQGGPGLPGSAVRVFLIVPRCASPKQTYREYPLGVGLIATALRAGGHATAIFDQNAEGPDDQRLFDRLRQFGPDIVGFSIVTPSYPVAQRQIARLRREDPALCIVAGGIHASLFPEDLLADGADVVVVGDGEQAMPPLVACVGDRPDVGEGARGGVSHCGGDLVRTPASPRTSADDLTVIDRDVYDLSLYSHHSMLASFGCPYHCAFCCNYAGTMMRRRVMIRPYDSVVAEMEYLAERYATRSRCSSSTTCSCSTAAISWPSAAAWSGPDWAWSGSRRCGSTPSMPRWPRPWRTPGASGSISAWNRARSRCCAGSARGSTRRRSAAEWAAPSRPGSGSRPAGCSDCPATLEEQYETVAFMRELRPHEVSIHQLIPFPGTEYYNHPAEHGLRIRDRKDFASFCYGGLSDNITFDYLTRGNWST